MASELKMQQEHYYGSCLCGGIRYQVDNIEPLMAHCHCAMCRKFHGAAFATFGEAKAQNFKWLDGAELLQEYRAQNDSIRRFCRVCGSSLTFAPAHNPDRLVEFSLGTLDSQISHRPDAHVYVKYKAGWSAINDGLPQFEEGRSGAHIGPDNTGTHCE